MFKKPILLLLAGAFALIAQAELRISHFGQEKEITMLVVPRDATTIQIAKDIARHYPVLQVCYQQAGDRLKIHAWNGKQWMDIPAEDYTNGTFFATPPQHAILIESKDSPAPDFLIPNGIWCTSGNRLTSTHPRIMIHLLGRYFDFPYRIWKDFSRRYNLPFEEINPTFINTRVWNLYSEQLLSKRDPSDPATDLDQWLRLHITPPAPIEPILIEKPKPLLPVEKLSKEAEKEKIYAEIKAAMDLRETEIKSTPTAPQKPEKTQSSEPVADPFSDAEIPIAEVLLF